MFDRATAEGLFGEVPVGAALEHLAPGAKLAAVIAGCDPASLSDYDLISYFSACERQTGWARGAQLAAISELDTRRTKGANPIQRAQAAGATAHEVAAELCLSRAGAEARVTLARALRRLPDTAGLLRTGRLDLTKTRAIVSAVTVLDDDAAHAVEAAVLSRAPEQTSPQLGQSLRRAVLKADPGAAQARHKTVVRDREVRYYPGDDGAATLWAHGPAPALHALFLAVTALADKAIQADQAAARDNAEGKDADDDTVAPVRTLAQARFDVLADFGLAHLNDPDLPRKQGRRPHLQLVVAATTLLGLDDDPAELLGHGPITADMARAIAGDATWTRLLTDPVSGVITDYGTTRYRPPPSLTNVVTTKHPTCRGLGCRQPASRCQIDHTIVYPLGPTAEHNLGPLCAHCHIHKHEADWDVLQLLDGTFLYTSPSGHTYRREADPPLQPNPPPDPADDIPPF